MAEDLNKKPEELQEEQLDEVSGGSIRDLIKDRKKSRDSFHPELTPNPSIEQLKDIIKQRRGS